MAIRAQYQKELRKVCPDIKAQSGIYFLTRNQPKAYIGKSVNVLQRMTSHLQSYEQPIDISLKKRKWHNEYNKLGWKLGVLYFPKEQLDEKEREYIQKYINAGYELYNKESGGTVGKTYINDRKPSKNYTDGVKAGYRKAQKEVQKYFQKCLKYEINGKDGVLKQKYYENFKKFLENH